MLTLTKKKLTKREKTLTKREKTRSSNVGRWARTMWDDIGVRDGIIVDKRDTNFKNNKNNYCYFVVYFPYDKFTDTVEIDQIISLGKYVEAKNSGL